MSAMRTSRSATIIGKPAPKDWLKSGLMFPARKWTQEDDDQLLAFLAEGKKSAVISKDIRRSESSVLQRAEILKRREK
jgi:hypothetical protein